MKESVTQEYLVGLLNNKESSQVTVVASQDDYAYFHPTVFLFLPSH